MELTIIINEIGAIGSSKKMKRSEFEATRTNLRGILTHGKINPQQLPVLLTHIVREIEDDDFAITREPSDKIAYDIDVPEFVDGMYLMALKTFRNASFLRENKKSYQDICTSYLKNDLNGFEKALEELKTKTINENPDYEKTIEEVKSEFFGEGTSDSEDYERPLNSIIGTPERNSVLATLGEFISQHEEIEPKRLPVYLCIKTDKLPLRGVTIGSLDVNEDMKIAYDCNDRGFMDKIMLLVTKTYRAKGFYKMFKHDFNLIQHAYMNNHSEKFGSSVQDLSYNIARYVENKNPALTHNPR